MLLLKRLILVSALFAGLTACRQELTFTYLIEHPVLLKKEIAKCQVMSQPSADEMVRCKQLQTIADPFFSAVNDQQEDPEKFGQLILMTQTACVEAKQEFLKSQQQLDTLKSRDAASNEIDDAEKQLNQAKKRYDDIQT